MKTLKEIGMATFGHSKCEDLDFEDYLPIYDKLWTPIRNNDIKLLEIGIGKGGSLKMWKEYFSNASIIGADVDRNKLYNEDRIQTVFVDQNNIESLKELANFGPYDIIIDDGGHTMRQQQNSLAILFDYVKSEGYYVVEDVCTSYWPHFEGSYPPESFTTIEALKTLCDKVNELYISYANYGALKNSRQTPNWGINNLKSISFYQGVVILEKK
jgi:hypothetical protein